MYSITARRMISGLVLKYLKEADFVITRRYATTLPVSTQVLLTGPSEALFGVLAFDHIILSYSLSMIPDWTGALAEAKRRLTPTGQLHVVDFGDGSDLPRWFQTMLRRWLKRFHVNQRHTLAAALHDLANGGGQTEVQSLFRRYSLYGRYSKAA